MELDIPIKFSLHKFCTKWKFIDKFVLMGDLIYMKKDLHG